MTIVVDLATGSTFISRIILHLSKIASEQEDESVSIIGTMFTLPVENQRRSTDIWMEMDLDPASSLPYEHP